MVRATPSVALHVLRSVEEMLLKSATHHVTVKAKSDIALYVLNQKRMHLRSLEETFLVNIMIIVDESLTGTHPFSVERGEIVMPGDVQIARPINPAGFIPVEEPEIDEVEDEIEEEETLELEASGEGDDDSESDRSSEGRGEGEPGEGGRRRRRRRRRRGGQGGEPRVADGSAAPMPLDAPQPSVSGVPFTGTHVIGEDGEIVTEREVMDKPNGEGEAGRRRRGRRGGRRNGRRDRPEGEAVVAGSDTLGEDSGFAEAAVEPVETMVEPVVDGVAEAEAVVEPKVKAAAVKKPRAPRKPKVAADAATAVVEPVTVEPVSTKAAPHVVEAAAPESVQPALPELITTEPVVSADPNKPKKGGWWAKAKA
jgi:ribonuclease E